ncbi:carbohydrate-binding protein [Actinomadura roseirufa]|uniref:carbohydrate-binding protein n=1 Tax=Actinomadura roseirufa TaxID=2094049 RepID=UPI0010416333|nr:carbohydrate-binding protein [Actinomadura roseirufa]
MTRRMLLASVVLVACTTVPVTAAASGPVTGPAVAGAAARPRTRPQTRPEAPDPNAPKLGRVEGARTFTPTSRNAEAVEKFRALHRARVQREQIHHFWGVEPAAGTHDGLMATHSVTPGYKVSNNADYTYTPTIKAAGSCMEITTVYSKAVGNEVWAWSWCGNDGPAKEIKMDADFLQTYTTTVNGQPAYNVQLVQTNASQNAWSAYLYNYKTKAWSLFFSKSGTDSSKLTYGWDIFEIYATRNPSTNTAYYCTEAKNVVFESSSIQLRKNGAWRAASPSDSPWQPTATPNPQDYLCPSLKFVRAGETDHWIVRQ